MFLDLADDPRENGPTLGDERATLTEYLRSVRLALELKCADLDAEAMARRAVEPSTMSLLGPGPAPDRDGAGVLPAGGRRRGSPPALPRRTRPDADFDGAVADPEVVAEAWAAWRTEVEFAERLVAAAPSLDATGEDRWRGSMSLREVMVEMLHEYARHLGHADLLRERIDGRIGQ